MPENDVGSIFPHSTFLSKKNSVVRLGPGTSEGLCYGSDILGAKEAEDIKRYRAVVPGCERPLKKEQVEDGPVPIAKSSVPKGELGKQYSRSLACAAGVCAILTSPAGFSAELKWETGWNLVTIPLSTESFSLPKGVRLWRFHGAQIEETNGQFERNFKGDSIFAWLHAAYPGMASIPARDSSLDLHPPLPQKIVQADWELLQVTKPSTFDDPSLRELWRWDPVMARYASVAAKTMLDPEMVYVGVATVTQSQTNEAVYGGPRADGRATGLRIFGPQRVVVYSPTYTIRGAVEPTKLSRLALRIETDPGDPRAMFPDAQGAFASEVELKEGPNLYTITTEDTNGYTQTETMTVIYNPEGPTETEAPSPPTGLVATSQGRIATISWQAPTQIASGRPIPPGVGLEYALYQNGTVVKQGITGTYAMDTLPAAPATHHYHVRALITDADGRIHRSLPSASIRLFAATPEAPTTPGLFEAPNPVSDPQLPARLPKTCMTVDGPRTTIHLAYVLPRDPQDPKRRDRIHYQQNRYAGSPRPGAWSTFFDSDPTEHRKTSGNILAIPAPSANADIHTLAIVAYGDRVDIAWVERPRPSSGSNLDSGRITLVRSTDGGRTFGGVDIEPWGAESSGVPRDLAMAYDHFGNHHMVWSAGHKVYYLKNLRAEKNADGATLNVFDEHRRRPATDLVKTKIKVDPVNGHCPCGDCWCEDAYLLADEPNPKKDRVETLKPYIDWWDDTFVYAPTLHVDRKSVSIVARQQKRWQPVPVSNPLWDRMYTDPVYSDEIVQRRYPTRLVIGWRGSGRQLSKGATPPSMTRSVFSINIAMRARGTTKTLSRSRSAHYRQTVGQS